MYFLIFVFVPMLAARLVTSCSARTFLSCLPPTLASACPFESLAGKRYTLVAASSECESDSEFTKGLEPHMASFRPRTRSSAKVCQNQVTPLRVGDGNSVRYSSWIRLCQLQSVRERFSSPLLQFAQADQGETFTLVECPSKPVRRAPSWRYILTTSLGGTGQLISRLTNDEIDLAMCVERLVLSNDPYRVISQRLDGCLDLRNRERLESI